MDLLRKSGEFPVSNKELDDTAATVYEGIWGGSDSPSADAPKLSFAAQHVSLQLARRLASITVCPSLVATLPLQSRSAPRQASVITTVSTAWRATAGQSSNPDETPLKPM